MPGSGEVSLSEFTAAVAQQNRNVAEAEISAWDRVLDYSLSAKGVESLAKQFKAMDTDGSGDLDMQEFGLGLARCGVTLSPREFRLFSRAVDVSGDGKVLVVVLSG